jgi:Uma2 family endonuclease
MANRIANPPRKPAVLALDHRRPQLADCPAAGGQRAFCRGYTELRVMAAQIIPAPLTSDDFLELYSEQEDGLRRFELFDGEVVERPMANRVHDEIKNVVMVALSLHFQRSPGYVARVETTFKLDGVQSFTPDLAVIGVARWKTMQGKFAAGSPDIAFEVVSSDRADRLQFKIDAYLDHGSKAVCCIYPARKKILVWMRDESFVFRTGGHLESPLGVRALEFPAILPGFSAALSEIFESAD